MSCKIKKQATVEENLSGHIFAGEFMYFTDAPVFRPCGNQQLFPVVMEKAYIEAERQYLNLTEGGTWIYIEFTGYMVAKKMRKGHRLACIR